ncbi:glycosyltransferase [Tuwongella immobilis]|uniref:Glycosyl transferase family 1 domain-containing protein n=1 Tax=Tuwongella immobilis TaxID=692036 RepID=A0A6C2YPK7_9BACT|nr:glycosyltransferase [Tuwongella immobilis]VIP03241.1 Uncharacterized protein OS=Arenimonas oryziterrae DSM 21050 = YC6267 GN=N789_00950 PE=4 SV=1: Glycos_transf_1 [Tuwongella immobilis]VTS03810.1 Uncharacterized protein OS=Arenimonas oryziterrae DSM 21050 = YC6267 GN=N789_00950 PE=4 SV=1: Glycos_transf_1 [Tuwongella immobilis]
MKVVILTPTLTEGDAVGNDVQGMAATLRQMGHRVILAVRSLTKQFPVVSYRQVPELLDSPDDLLIYHHSICFEEAVRMIEKLNCRKIVKYHNITPPQFFEGVSRDLIRYCQEGLNQVPRLMRPDVRIWSDSAYNCESIHAHDPNFPVEVLAPFHQVQSLLDARAESMGIGMNDDWLTNILVLGRIVPNKNILLAVETFAEYHRQYNPNSRLVIVGEAAHRLYNDKVLKRIRALKIGGSVVLAGKVTLEQLKAYFLVSQALLCTSSHEGFCVPLIEGMGMRVPIVAVSNTAIPGTAGPAALYADDAAGLAAHLNRLRTDSDLLERQLLAGVNRYHSEFSTEAIAARFRLLLDRALAETGSAVAA